MKGFRCDSCLEWKMGESPIETKGYANRKGDILLPTGLIEHHFCSPECLEHFVAESARQTGGDDETDNGSD